MADQGYKRLADEDYNSLADESTLKGLLRVRELSLLAQDALAARAILHQIQVRMLQRAWRFPVRYLPLLLCRGPARSGANFLRWRNQENNRSGVLAWQELMQSPQLPPQAREALLQIEHDRIVFNMQMSVLTFILRQCRECAKKNTDADTLAASLLPSPDRKHHHGPTGLK